MRPLHDEPKLTQVNDAEVAQVYFQRACFGTVYVDDDSELHLSIIARQHDVQLIA